MCIKLEEPSGIGQMGSQAESVCSLPDLACGAGDARQVGGWSRWGCRSWLGIPGWFWRGGKREMGTTGSLPLRRKEAAQQGHLDFWHLAGNNQGEQPPSHPVGTRLSAERGWCSIRCCECPAPWRCHPTSAGPTSCSSNLSEPGQGSAWSHAPQNQDGPIKEPLSHSAPLAHFWVGALCSTVLIHSPLRGKCCKGPLSVPIVPHARQTLTYAFLFFYAKYLPRYFVLQNSSPFL